MELEVAAVNGAQATDNGSWIDIRGFAQATLQTKKPQLGANAATFTLKVMGSNAPAKPADSADGPQIGSDITAEGLVSITVLPVKWIKVKVSSYSDVDAGADKDQIFCYLYLIAER